MTLFESHPAFVEKCETLASRIVIIADNHLKKAAQILQQSFEKPCDLITFKASERTKTQKTKTRLENRLFKLGCTRDTCLLAVGGGVTLDLVGFVAATFCRGVPVAYVPTSLLAMVDAAIGGKTSVNTRFGKNLLGVFKQPDAVLIDVNYLKTLPEKNYTDGLSEVIKHALLSGEAACDFLIRHREAILAREPKIVSQLVLDNIALKQKIVAQDVEDHHARQQLNLGHTLAHAYECASRYRITHGEAVALGLIEEAKLAESLGHASSGMAKKTERLIFLFHKKLPDISRYQSKALLDVIMRDKKNRDGKVGFAFLCDLGKCAVFSMPARVLWEIYR